MKNSHQNTATVILPFSHNRLTQPNTDNRAAAGTIVFLNNEPAIIVYRVDVPILGHHDGAVDIYGDSMAPTFPPGCKVGIHRLNNSQHLVWGDCYYIININFQGIIRRVYQGDTKNSLRLVCDNIDQERFPSMQFEWDHIAVIFGVRSTFIKH